MIGASAHMTPRRLRPTRLLLPLLLRAVYWLRAELLWGPGGLAADLQAGRQ